MRHKREVQIAHDVIHAIAAKEVDLGLSEEQRKKFHVAHDVLSWALEGPCGDTFQAILLEAMREAERRGYELVLTQ